VTVIRRVGFAFASREMASHRIGDKTPPLPRGARNWRRGDYERWIGTDPDPRDLLRPFASEALRIWPISTRVNKPENDDASILDEVPVQAMERI